MEYRRLDIRDAEKRGPRASILRRWPRHTWLDT